MSEMGTDRANSAYVSAALLCLATLASACSSKELHATPEPGSYPIPGCEGLDLTPCDTQNRTCQLSRLELAACLRETDPGTLPVVNVMTEQEYVDYVNGLYAGSQSTKKNHTEVAMTWLGLAQPGSFRFVPLTREDVADWFGTYRWRQGDLLLVDHGKRADDVASNVALVSALIRALRDRDIDIAAWSTVVSIVDVDSNWGSDALYFGEARFYSNRYKASLEGLDPSRIDELAQINDDIREDIAWIRAQPSPYVATNDRFPHNFGARLAYLAWKRNGADGIESLYDTKFITQQLMASETQEGQAPALKLHDKPVAPAEWLEDPIITAIGAWGLFLSLSKNLETDVAWPLALRWRGDQVYIYRSVEPSEDTALVWQVETEDEASAISLETELEAGTPAAEVRRSGTLVTLAMTSNQSSLEWAFVAN